MTETRSLTITNIIPNPDQPRRHFDAAALTELADSIKSVGLLEPIIVKPRDGDWNSRHWRTAHYTIVAGERRWRAAKIAGLTRIDALVRSDLDDRSAFELSMIENVIRADMNPIEEANGYQTLVDAGLTVDDISTRLGKSVAAIKSRLGLLRLAPPLRDLTAAGQMDAWTASHIAKLSSESQFKASKALSDGLLNPADKNAVDRLCSALAEIDSKVDLFDDFMAPPAAATFTTLADMPPANPDRIARERIAADTANALRLLESVADTIDDGIQLSPESATRLTALAARIAKAVYTADAKNIAASL